MIFTMAQRAQESCFTIEGAATSEVAEPSLPQPPILPAAHLSSGSSFHGLILPISLERLNLRKRGQ
jgi:hypothetical protein